MSTSPTTPKQLVPPMTTSQNPHSPSKPTNSLDSSSCWQPRVPNSPPVAGADSHQTERTAYRPPPRSATAKPSPVTHSRPRTPTQTTPNSAHSPPHAVGSQLGEHGVHAVTNTSQTTLRSCQVPVRRCHPYPVPHHRSFKSVHASQH